MVWCEEGNIGFVSERFVVEPGPAAVDIRRIGDNEVESTRDVLEKVGLDEAEIWRVEIYCVLSGGVECGLRDIGTSDGGFWVF